VYQSQAGQVRWLMIGYGLEYYLARDLRPGTALPHQLFIERTAAQADRLYPVPCQDSAACLNLGRLDARPADLDRGQRLPA
jgi:hypothetical protein